MRFGPRGRRQEETGTNTVVLRVEEDLEFLQTAMEASAMKTLDMEATKEKCMAMAEDLVAGRTTPPSMIHKGGEISLKNTMKEMMSVQWPGRRKPRERRALAQVFEQHKKPL
jgi:hypothetical protein